MNRMARQRNDLLTAPPMAVLRRPLTDAEARRLKGESVIDRRKAVAELARIMESDDEYAAERARTLLCRLIYNDMSTRMFDPRNGFVTGFVANVRKAERSFARALR